MGRRRNEERFLAKDVLSDPLLSKNDCFDEKMKQSAASLARERWQFFNDLNEEQKEEKAPLYDGHSFDCKINENMANLKRVSLIFYGLMDEQKQCFDKAFNEALAQNPNLNRPAINPSHALNIKQQRIKWSQYQKISKQVFL